MSVFVDTSALLTMLDADEGNHQRARDAWITMIEQNEDIVCTNYVLVETYAVAQRRLGIQAIRSLEEYAVPLLRVVWITVDDHRSAVQALLLAGCRQLSLVDCTSFATMRQLGIRTVFTFDPHFAEQGFECIP